jgi:hypothetical protein
MSTTTSNPILDAISEGNDAIDIYLGDVSTKDFVAHITDLCPQHHQGTTEFDTTRDMTKQYLCKAISLQTGDWVFGLPAYNTQGNEVVPPQWWENFQPRMVYLGNECDKPKTCYMNNR